MILITGGGGLVGLNLARDLLYRGAEVLLLQRHAIEVPSFLTPFWDNQVKGVIGDIEDLAFLFDLMRKYPVDSIVHAAGTFEGRGGEGSLYQRAKVNVQGTANIMEVGRICGVRRITYISSIGVYLGRKEPWSEDVDLPSISCTFIGNTKKAAEQICFLYIKEYGLSIPIIRLARVYGPTAHWRRNPMIVMITDAVAGKSIDLSHVPGGGGVVPIYAKDCAKGISLVHLADSLNYPIYNLSGGELYNWFEIARMVKEIIPGAEIRLGTAQPEEKLKYYNVPVERIAKDVGFIPNYDVKQGIMAYVDWLREGKY